MPGQDAINRERGYFARLDFRRILGSGLFPPRVRVRGDDRGLIFPKKRLEIEPNILPASRLT